MAGSLTDAGEVEIALLLTGQATTIWTTTPIPQWVALYTVAPTDSTAGTEVTGGSYARMNTTGQWGAPVSGAGTVSNNANIVFPTATVSWGTVLGWGLLTASTGGILLVGGTLTASKLISIGDVASFPIASFVLTIG